MRERKFEVRGDKLLDIGALNVVGLLELDDFENLPNGISIRNFKD